MFVLKIILFSQTTRDTVLYEPSKLYVSFLSPQNLNINNSSTVNGNLNTSNETLNKTLENFKVNRMFRFLPQAPDKSELSRLYMIECNCIESELMDRLNEYKHFIEYAERIPKNQVDYVTPFTPNDYSVNDLWHLEKIAARMAWGVSNGFLPIPIAITDTGYDTLHVDLRSQIIHMHNNVWEIIDKHGTSTAGIASMTTHNGIGYSSIGGLNTKLMLYKGLTYSNLYQAALDGAKVINASWSGFTYSQANQSIIDNIYQMGAIVVAAGSTVNQCKYPACYNHVIAVAGTDRNDIKTDDSGYYPQLDISAPAVDIMTTKPGSTYGISYATSAAAPIVTGVCGMILSVKPSYNPDEVTHIVKSTADPIDHLPGNAPYVGMLGAGRVNAYKAVRKAASLHFQNVSLSGTKTYNCAYDTYFGSNVINPMNQGNVTIVSGANITVNADEFYLEPGFEVQLGGTLTIQ